MPDMNMTIINTNAVCEDYRYRVIRCTATGGGTQKLSLAGLGIPGVVVGIRIAATVPGTVVTLSKIKDYEKSHPDNVLLSVTTDKTVINEHGMFVYFDKDMWITVTSKNTDSVFVEIYIGS